MSKFNLILASLVVAGIVQEAAVAQTDRAGEGTVSHVEPGSTEGNGSSIWPDIAEIIERLLPARRRE